MLRQMMQPQIEYEHQYFGIGDNNYFGTPGTSNFGFNSGVLNPGAILIARNND
jgi:hypothetical protein